jgi:hypothetical protein
MEITKSVQNVKECTLSLKSKNTEGFDRTQHRVLNDDIIHLLAPFTALMNKIYNDKEIPTQWKISKIIPVHKNGESSNI